MTFAEFEVWGQNTPIPPNLALNRPTTSTTPLMNAGPTGPELANDGNIAGHFWLESVFITDGTTPPYDGPFGNGHYWQTQLAQPSAINYVRLFARHDDVSNNGMTRISIVAADGTTIVTSADVNLDGTQTGNNFNLNTYDLTHVFASNPVGSFVRIESLDNTKKLALAEVEVFGPPVMLPGDHNNDGKVNAADYVVWRRAPLNFGGPDGYTAWRTNFGNPPGSGASLGNAAVPEPAALSLLGVVALLSIGGMRKRRSSVAG
jgi:hypothetical protein